MGKRWQIHVADVLRWLTEYDGEPFDAVVTDPPYSSGGATRGDRTASTRAKYVSSDAQRDLPDFAGDNRDGRSFVFWCSMWLLEAWRRSKEGAVLYLYTDWRQIPSMTDAVQAGGWVWRGIVPWDKINARPQQGRQRPQCEYLIFATRGAHAAWDGAPYLPGFLRGAAPHTAQRLHITQKSVEVTREVVRSVVPDGLVLDPFVGSGAIGEAVLLEGRRYVGLELLEPIAEAARRRLEGVETCRTHDEVTSGQGSLFEAGT